MTKQLVLMDHDGAVDDFLALTLLLRMPSVELLGVVVTPADCYIGAALSVTRKLLDWLGRSDVPVAESTVRGINPFPPAYRRDSVVIDNLPVLNERDEIRTPLVPESGVDFMANALSAAPRPVTLMVTGPLSTLAEVLERDPSLFAHIDRVVWMGGALNVPGNVERLYAPEHDGSAEWNAFWDPPSVARVWATEIPIILCSLDLTNEVPLTAETIRQVAKQRSYPLSDFVGTCYALALPQDYYCWDILATAYLDRPDLYETTTVTTEIVATGSSQGRTRVTPSGGRPVQVMAKVNKPGFYQYLLQQWAL
ncbi:Inosine-uridine nucleoside N-ribohydrolase [Rubidibacter lacunae KORDI 51-2]|uniref:Inosine-uridine nucleoside N-ribohydrolase n=1 Tax=Rubidibacter lacunae KORDI 51-2 TaxID=582515 RepID=U5DKJ9_9CHRO|nr:nucleoside hydrolase [Rubidibacter lacunae]ERN42201.1 Inosine-uridine nucleoside N-ribohydrolase [Rubidibacter lacunae KORDI 51-2]